MIYAYREKLVNAKWVAAYIDSNTFAYGRRQDFGNQLYAELWLAFNAPDYILCDAQGFAKHLRNVMAAKAMQP